MKCLVETCNSEYPIIDGIPLLVADLDQYMTQHAHEILWRSDLSPKIEGLVGDILGPGVVYDTNRHYLSAYVDGHFRDCDSGLRGIQKAPLSNFLTPILDRIGGKNRRGNRLDIGSSVGRASFELAKAGHPDDLVLGVDLNFTKLRFAQALMRHGSVEYPRRRLGVIYDTHRIEYPDSTAINNVDFWVCDGTSLPFQDATFTESLSLNVLDCVASPTRHLMELLRLMPVGGTAFIASPFDWTGTVTPVDQWLGGHSQHNEWHGSSEAILRASLDELRGTQNQRFTIRYEEEVPWEVRINQRHSSNYASLLLELSVALDRPENRETRTL